MLAALKQYITQNIKIPIKTITKDKYERWVYLKEIKYTRTKDITLKVALVLLVAFFLYFTHVVITYDNKEYVPHLKEDGYILEQEYLADNYFVKPVRIKNYLEKIEGLSNPVAKLIPKIYQHFSESEVWFLFQIVEAEVTGNRNFDAKARVASVIFNRWNTGNYASLSNILTAESQFSTYWNGSYRRVTVTEATISACEYVYEYGDTSGGAMFFDSCDGDSWAARNRPYMYTDEVGHAFYR